MFGWVNKRYVHYVFRAKETAFERADFALQLLMFVTEEEEGRMFIIFFLSIFC